MAIRIRPPECEIRGPWWHRMVGDTRAVYWEGPDDIQPGRAFIKDEETGEVLSELYGPNISQARACVKWGAWWDLQTWPGQYGIPEHGAVTYQVAAE